MKVTIPGTLCTYIFYMHFTVETCLYDGSNILVKNPEDMKSQSQLINLGEWSETNLVKFQKFYFFSGEILWESDSKEGP